MLAGVGAVTHGLTRDSRGQPLRGRMGDSESLARLPDGEWLLGFERWHGLMRYRQLGGPAQPVEPPPGLSGAPDNGGLETLAVLADGRILGIAESLPGTAGEGSRMAWLGTQQQGRMAWSRLSYHPAPGLEPTDAAGLPDGSALVLERHFSLFGGFSCRLAHVPASAFRAGGVLRGETWLDMPPDLPAENWEGVAAARVGGRLLVILATDDNENPFQRSLLALYEVA